MERISTEIGMGLGVSDGEGCLNLSSRQSVNRRHFTPISLIQFLARAQESEPN